MKPSIFPFLLFLFLSIHTQAQFSLSLAAGPNWSTAKFTQIDAAAPEARLGYFFGLTPKFRLNKRFSINTEFQFTTEGFDTKARAVILLDPQIFISTNKANFFRVIPQLSYTISKNFSLQMGINWGIKVSEKQSISFHWFGLDEFLPLKQNDFGISIGPTFHLGRLFLTAKYHHGLLNQDDIDYDKYIACPDGYCIDVIPYTIHTRNLQIGIGYQFGNQ